jgi:hypothetical protein
VFDERVLEYADGAACKKAHAVMRSYVEAPDRAGMVAGWLAAGWRKAACVWTHVLAAYGFDVTTGQSKVVCTVSDFFFKKINRNKQKKKHILPYS